MRPIHFQFLLLLTLLPTMPVLSQTAPAEIARPTSKTARHEKILRLFELSGVDALGVQVQNQLFASLRTLAPDIPDALWTAVRARIKPRDVMEILVPVYEKHFTEEDVDALIAFYSSPVGRRFVQKQPLILDDSIKLLREWAERIAPEIVRELQKGK